MSYLFSYKSKLKVLVCVGQRRSTTEKETCANLLQRLFFGNIMQFIKSYLSG